MKALKVRTEYHACVSQSQFLVKAIEENDEWLHARNDDNLGVLKTALETLEAKISPIWRRFAATDPAAARKTFSEREIEDFTALQPAIDELKKYNKSLVQRHNAGK